ncbi:MAG: HNH endonuclease, partial [Alphaproteobacteria bacterium]|nr:HNH endonuclease [Alphaproteobacteria bacterium]
MGLIPLRLRDAVVARADNRCEYCRLSQLGQEATFHVDHVRPRAAGGGTTLDNLALACVSCSLRKGARTQVIGLESGEQIPLFSPRTQAWAEHFSWDGPRVVALTATGRATVAALALNRALILAIRQEEAYLGRHPPGQAGTTPGTPA